MARYSVLGELILLISASCIASVSSAEPFSDLRLLPYPQQIERHAGKIAVGPPDFAESGVLTPTEQLAADTLKSYLPTDGDSIPVHLGSLEEGFNRLWISQVDIDFLNSNKMSDEASVIYIRTNGITIVGKGAKGMLYGAQTINQLDIQAKEEGANHLPCIKIKDWPDMRWRCLSPTLTWYSGYNRLEGYDLCNWTYDEWKWLADWSLLHKCNAWAVCMYGYWPFTLPGYESNTLDVDSFRFNPKTGKKEPWRFTHKNIKKEFLPDLIKYANDRGIDVHAYIGKNSFNGTFWLSDPAMNGEGAAELLPFAPGVSEYWKALVKRILEIGFNGFVFEDPEAYHVPNSNDECYKTFWEPWADTYGFKNRSETDANKPPLGVHIEYYAWLFRQFDDAITEANDALGRKEPSEIYLISHILLSRIVNESKTAEERDKWLSLVDDKQGRKVPFIIFEGDEQKYADIFGGDRVATLGGRGGSCTCAMRRIASINNDWSYSPMAANVDYERDCQTRMYKAGGFGAMGYIFEWTNTEVFGYIASQYLWKNSGIPKIDDGDKHQGFLEYAYRHYYGDKAGRIAAKAHDMSACVNDAMVLEGVHGSQFPETGKTLHRDFQYLAARADEAWKLSKSAYREFTGKDPNLYKPTYKQDDFTWNGYDPKADYLFKAERLRLLCVSARRCQMMCEAALANRLSRRLIHEGASVGSILKELDRSIKAARENQKLYQINYDDDYDWTDGLCAKLTEQFESLRDQLIIDCGGGTDDVISWAFDAADDPLGWTGINDLSDPVAKNNALVFRATGADPCVVQSQPMDFYGDNRTFVEIKMRSNTSGMGKIFWAIKPMNDPAAYPFAESRRSSYEVQAGNDIKIYRVFPSWNGKVTGLRLDIPINSTVEIDSISVRRLPDKINSDNIDLDISVQSAVAGRTPEPLYIPWEKTSDILPKHQTAKLPGIYLDLNIGLNQKYDFYKLGVVYTVQAFVDGKWKNIFRRAIDRRASDWEHWDILVDKYIKSDRMKLRLVADSYTRAQNRDLPQWNWAIYGDPKIIKIDTTGKREILYSIFDKINDGRFFVKLDSDVAEREFDGTDFDSSGAVFYQAKTSLLDKLISANNEDTQYINGFIGWISNPSHLSPYKCYLGTPMSGWVYAHENTPIRWSTSNVPAKKDTVVAFVAGTDYAKVNAELWCDGSKLIDFTTGNTADEKWSGNGAELRYIHGGNTVDERTTHGLSGIYLLELPAESLTLGKPIELSVRFPQRDAGWFMVHEYRDVFDAVRDAALPQNSDIKAIISFTPHTGNQFGTTIAEYDIDL